MTATRRIFYTADIIRPDGSDTWVYGDPCEPGHGATLVQGWVDFSWSPWIVTDEREDAQPDDFSVKPDTDDPIAWLANRLATRLGYVEDDGGDTLYAADSRQNYETGEYARYAAHVEGFTPEEIEAAVKIVNGR